MIAIIPVRAGVVPIGGLEAAVEAGGDVVLIGTDVASAVDEFAGLASTIALAEVGPFAPGAWAVALAAHLQSGHTATPSTAVLPHSPDGRDLAPRLARALGRPLVAGAIQVDEDEATVARRGGVVMETLGLTQPVVATLQPGVRSALPDPSKASPVVTTLSLSLPVDVADPRVVEELPPDPATMDLSEAPRIVGGGAGLGSAEAFEQLQTLADALGASMGGTRVVSDWGWIPFERQIGTTGVIVDPDLYLALGISGAVQHTAGLGSPNHIICVNTDPHCPMMAMADLAIVCDAPAFLTALTERRSRRGGSHR